MTRRSMRELERAIEDMDLSTGEPDDGIDIDDLTEAQKEGLREILRYRQRLDAGGTPSTDITPELVREAKAAMDPELAAALEEL